MGREIIKAVQKFYVDSTVGMDVSELFLVKLIDAGLCTVSIQCTIYMDGVVREVNARLLRRMM